MKKTIAVSTALALALSLTACGKKDTSADAALSNDIVLNDDGAAEVNLSDNALDTGTSDNAAGVDAADGNVADNAL